MGAAQKLRRAMQGLETAMQRAEESPSHVTALADRIAAAEAARVPGHIIKAARALQKGLLLSEVSQKLNTTYKLSALILRYLTYHLKPFDIQVNLNA